MPIVFDVKFERYRLARRGGARRAFNAGLREGIRDALGRWHREILPKHFSVGGKTAYRYERRDRITREIKQRSGQNPLLDLVAEGKTRRYALHAPRITATSQRGRIRVSVPQYIIAVQNDPTAPPVGDEITRVNNRDRRMIAGWIDAEIRRRMTASQR